MKKIDNIYEIINYLDQEDITKEEINNIRNYINSLEINNFKFSLNICYRCKLLMEYLNIKLSEIELEKEKNRIKLLESRYREYLDKYLNEINNYNSSDVIFTFSGVKNIQNVEGNRPIKMTLEFIKKNIPVIYSFWTWAKEDYNIDYYQQGILFQSPINKTLENIDTIIKYDFKEKNKIFILSFPYPDMVKHLELLKQYKWKIIYDIRDDWQAFNQENQADWYNYNSEIYSIEMSDIITTVSKPLLNKFKNINPNKIYLSPNALDKRFITESNDCIKTKIGYVGNLSNAWFDWNKLIYTATKLEDYTFEIIGDYSCVDLSYIPKNVNMLGFKNFEEVKVICKEWKVGLIPFKEMQLSYGVDPIKVYEYLAMGLKVVSSQIPQIEGYPEVKVAKCRDEFVKNIKESMEEEFNKNLVNKFLSYNTWEDRVNDLLNMVR